MKTITKIEANRSVAVHRKCRVAAYCRVSTEHDDQIESLGTQKEHPSTLRGWDTGRHDCPPKRTFL